MVDENDKTDHKVPRFDHQNKSVSRDACVKTYLHIPPYLHFARTKKIVDVDPDFLKMVDGNEDETWFKMQV
jgi:hypothetical protein